MGRFSEALYSEYEGQEVSAAERFKSCKSEARIEWCKRYLEERLGIVGVVFKDVRWGGFKISGPTWFILKSMQYGDDDDVNAIIFLAGNSKKNYRHVLEAAALLRKQRLAIPRKVEDLILDVATGAIKIKDPTGRRSETAFKWAVCDCIDFLSFRLGMSIDSAMTLLAAATEREFATIAEYWKKKHKQGGWPGRRIRCRILSENMTPAAKAHSDRKTFE